jgi:tumor protein p53-inducible protein 3
MRAVVIDHPGDAQMLRIGQVPDPTPGASELLLRVRATALNRLDLLQRRGMYPVPSGASEILGVEAAGEVVAIGDGLEGWQLGERVCALLLGGGYAEYVAVPAGMAMRIPERISFEEAAAIPEVFLTAYLNLFTLAELPLEGVVLIHAGASGVGTAAIQLANAVGATSIVTVGSAAKAAFCRTLGAALALDYHAGPFAPAVLQHLGDRRVDVVLDMVGAPYWEQNLECLALGGRLILIGMLGGSRLEVDLAAIQQKRLRVIGTTLRPLPLETKIALTREFSTFALPRFASGQLRAVIDRVYSWKDAAEAHRAMESNLNMGKIVLRID